MKKIIIGLFLCLSSQIVSAESVNSMMDLKEGICDVSNVGTGVSTSTRNVGDFKIQTVCTSNKTNTITNNIFTIKESPVSKDEFYKQLNSYRLKGNPCTSDLVPSKESTVGSKKFKEVCSTIGSYGTYFIDGEAVETYEVFFNTLMTEAISKTTSSNDYIKDNLKNNPTIKPLKAVSCLISTKTFKPLGLGMETSNVRAVQERLKTLKYLSATPNGYYGKGTTNAVKAFQKDKKIQITGNVGPKTLQALNSLCSS